MDVVILIFVGVVETELGRHITDVYGRFALLFLAFFVGPFTKVRFILIMVWIVH